MGQFRSLLSPSGGAAEAVEEIHVKPWIRGRWVRNQGRVVNGNDLGQLMRQLLIVVLVTTNDCVVNYIFADCQLF